MKKALHHSSDFVGREFNIPLGGGLKASFACIDGLVDKVIINSHILEPLMVQANYAGGNIARGMKAMEWVEKHLLTAGAISHATTIDDALYSILTGDTALFIEGSNKAIVISTKGWEKRSIEEPQSELILKGPRDGFIESIQTNMSSLRRKLPIPELTFDMIIVGRRSKTKVCVAYISDLAKPSLVEEIRKRIGRIDIDVVLAAGRIEQFIEDNPFSPFPQVRYSERPDVVASLLSEGRAAIMIDGTPVVNVVPMLFLGTFQSPDDYNFRPYYSSIIRLFRFIAFLASISLPGIYIALTGFHQELLPTSLVVTLASALEGTPFPVAVEVILMAFIFEILREAGIRLPRNIGPTISIVGALVLGQSAVQSGLVSTATVVIIAFTAISSFVVPTLAEVSSLLRIFLTIIAAIYGAYGLLIGFSLILLHLCSLRSFGIPYLSPLAPLVLADLKDALIRAPHWILDNRPESLEPQELRRQKPGQMPGPPKGDGQ